MKGGACDACARGVSPAKGAQFLQITFSLHPANSRTASRWYDNGACQNLIAAEQDSEQLPRILAVVAGEDVDQAARRSHNIVAVEAVLVSKLTRL